MLKGLAFFTKVSGPRCWNIISFHSPHSLTWSWILSFSLFRGDERRAWPLFGTWRTNNGRQWTFRVPWIGLFHWHRQQPMWYRDIFRQERDERDRLEHERYLEREAAAETAAHIKAYQAQIEMINRAPISLH